MDSEESGLEFTEQIAIAEETPFKKPDLTRKLNDEEIDLLRQLTKKEKVYEIVTSLFDEDEGDEIDYYFYQTMPRKDTIARYTTAFNSSVTKASNIMMFDTSLNDKTALDALVEKYPNVGLTVANQLNKLTGIGGNASLKKR